MGKKNKKEKIKPQVEEAEIIEEGKVPLEEHMRAFIDLNTKGAASGGTFFRSDLVEHVEKLEKSGKDRVVGIVYDGTYNVEIVTQPIQEDEKFDSIFAPNGD